MNANLEREGAAQSREHLLLTVLGIKPRSAVYALGDQECEANLSPLALLELLGPEERPSRVLAICTPQAKADSWEILKGGLKGALSAEPVEVSNEGNQDDVGSFLSAIADKIPADVDLTVDVTHGLRHYSFLTYIAVMYLAALRGLRVRGAYYGLLQNAPAVSPFINLGPLLELQDLVYAVRTLRDTGSAMPLAAALGADVNGDPRYGHAASPSGSEDPVSELIALSEAHASGLPLEFGNLVHSVLQRARRQQARLERMAAEAEALERQGAGKGVSAKSFQALRFLGLATPADETDDGLSGGNLPLVDELIREFHGVLEPFELRAGANWKSRIALDETELRRQANVIDYQLRCRNTSTAIGMMHEWTVSWSAWCKKDEKGWLQYTDSRRRAIGALNQVKPNSCGSEAAQCSCSAPQKCRLATFWSDLTELRNSTHHHGMTVHDLLVADDRRDKLGFVLEYWNGTLKACPDYNHLLEPVSAPDKRVLVSPVGMTPGVLLTALEACRSDDDMGEPSSCIIVCSNESKEMVDEALRTHGKYEGAIDTLIFQDPQGGVSELGRITASARQFLEDAKEVVVNVTGGTTLMGVAVEKIASHAQKMASSHAPQTARNSQESRVRRIGLIDRRPREQQESDPYVVGDVIWIDD